MSFQRKRGRLFVLLLVAITVLIFFRAIWPESRRLDGPEDIRNSTLGFQEIFVVNLAERTDRRDAMTLMAALTGLRFTYVDGVRGEDVPEKALPPGPRSKNVQSPGKIGNWRAHMNVLQRIVRENLTSALIMEDDLDWDVRLKSECQKVAVASQKFLQPMRRDKSRSLADAHLYDPDSRDDQSHDVNVLDAPSTTPTGLSPYGDDWDILWLGHTGGDLARDWQDMRANRDYPPRSLLTIFIPDDDAVPVPRHLKRHPFADRVDRYAELFPPHTRVVHEARGFGGAQAYAVSQRGARRLLQKFGLDTLTDMWDICMRDFCERVYSDERVEDRPVCVATNPPLIVQYWGGGGSDLQNIGGGYFHKTGSISLRYSVRLNMKRLLTRSPQGSDDIQGLVDQWPDNANGPW